MARVVHAMSWVEDTGQARGPRGSSSVWLALWVLAVGYRYIKRLAAPEHVVVREQLRPGEQLLVTHFEQGTEGPDPTAKKRRKKRRR